MAITSIGSLSGKWNVAAEHDWVKLNLSANTLYAFSLTGAQSPSLVMLDASGNVVESMDGMGEKLGFMSATGGTFYLDIADSGRSTASYTLTAATSDDDYRNNTSTTGAVSVGGSAAGVWNVVGDHDWFKVNLSANTLYSIAATGGTYPFLTMFDASGQPVGRSDSFGMMGGAGFMPVTSGAYYVGVADLGGGSGAYTLAVTASADDYRSNVTTSGTVAAGATVAGTWNVANDHDWIKVNLTGNTLYSFKVTGGAYSLLNVMDANGSQVGAADATGNELGFMPASSGIYYVDIADASGATGSYSLALTAVADDYRSNVTTSGAVAIGSNLAGALNTAGDHDWIKVSLNANALYSFSITGLAMSTLSMYDANGSPLYASDAHGSRLGFMPASTGTYYIDVTGMALGASAYSLATALVADDYRSNVTTSGTVAVGGSVTGTLNTVGDHDWIKVSLSANTLYAITATGVASPSLAVYDAAGNSTGTLDASGQSLGFMPVTTGTYYIDVADSSSFSTTSNYTLSVAAATDDYRNNVSTSGALGSSGGGGSGTTGTAGNDVLQGTSGNDSFNGAAGTDTAVFTGSLSGYRISFNRGTGTGTVTDTQAARDGTDTITSIEKLQFGGKTFDLFNLPRTETPSYAKTPAFLFDAAYYLLKHPDLVPTLTLATAFDSYKTTAAQGAAPNAWFDPVYYANRWADLKSLNLDAATLFAHYNLYGVWEGRSAGPIFDKFDGNAYLTANPDVANYVDAFVKDFLGSRTNGAIAHYVIYGANEGRVAHDTTGALIPADFTVEATLIGQAL